MKKPNKELTTLTWKHGQSYPGGDQLNTTRQQFSQTFLYQIRSQDL